MHTAIGILQAVDDGRLDLDLPLSTFLPELDMASDPGSFSRITLRQALSHQGAFYDEVDWSHAPEDEQLAAWAADYTQRSWLMAEPGRFWNYSNPGYSLAGLGLERVDPHRRSYAEIIEEDVFRALGMGRATFSRDAAEADLAAVAAEEPAVAGVGPGTQGTVVKG
jgi:D-alanyl-D-alanine carboxypeptidase